MSFRNLRSFSICSKGIVSSIFAAALVLAVTGSARAENEGLDDLDQASDKKLKAEQIEDLGPVIDLCESALKKGLDPTNTTFANNLLVGTLMQRAEARSRQVVGQRSASWPALRVLVLSDLEKALKIDPKLAPAQLLIAKVQAQEGGDKKLALAAAEKATDLSKDDPETMVESLLLRAVLTEDADKRIDFCSQALKIAPANQEVLKARGEFYIMANKPELALADFEAASKADPNNVQFQELRAGTLVKLKRFDDAVKIFADLIKRSPDNPMLYLSRARIYAIDKKNTEALDDISHVLKLDPDNVVALLLRAQVHQQSGDIKAARSDVDEIMKDRPDLVDKLLEFHAVLSAGDGDFKQAIEDFESLRKIVPKNANLLEKLGMLYSLDKRPHKAIELYTESLNISPEQFVALEGRANMYLNVGQHAEAIADYNKAMKIKADDTGVLNNLAWVLATSPDDKVRDGKRSVELGTEAAKFTNNKAAHILSTLAAGYAETGDFETAKKWSQKAVEAGKDDALIDEETKAQLKKELASYENSKPWREKMEEKDREDSATSDKDKGSDKAGGKTADKPDAPAAEKSDKPAGEKSTDTKPSDSESKQSNAPGKDDSGK